jgi:TRAP-type C4-dicarboxylate transport system permease small subunit
VGWFYAAYEWVRKVNTASIAVACVLIVLMTLLTLWEVITRYFFRQPAMWTFPVTSYMLLYSVMLAAAYTLQKGGHVRVEVFVELLPPGPRRWVERLAHVLGLVFVLIFLQQATRHTWRLLLEGDRDISTLSVPLWIPSIVMTVGAALLALTYVFVVVDSFLRPPGQPTIQDLEQAQGRASVEAD